MCKPAGDKKKKKTILRQRAEITSWLLSTWVPKTAGVLLNPVSNSSVDKNNSNIILWVSFFLLGQLKNNV